MRSGEYTKILTGGDTVCQSPHPFIPVPNTVQVVHRINSLGEVCENVYHVRYENPPTLTDLQAIVSVFTSFWGDNIKQLVTSATELTEIIATDLSAQDGIQLDVGLTGQGGSAMGVALPNNVAAVISWGTGHRGKSYRGRTYYVGMASDSVVQNKLTDTEQQGFAAAGAWLLGHMPTGAHLAIVSYCNNKAWRTTGLASDIVSHTAEHNVRTQRRRLPR